MSTLIVNNIKGDSALGAAVSLNTSNTNVGLGNNTPSHKLRVEGDVSLSGGVYANDIYVGNTTVYSTVNATSFNGTANNSTNFGGLSLVVVQGQISGNAATAFSNAVSYVDNKLFANTSQLSANIATVQSQITSNSTTAYSNAVSYVDSKSFANTSQLSTNVSTLQTQISSNAATAYSNATTYASNASNITSGTLAWDRLPAGTVNTSGSFTYTGTQTFNGSSSLPAVVVSDIVEPVTISATAASGTINYDVTTQSILYYTTNASQNWTMNFRGSSGTPLNTLLSTGQAITVTFLATQGSTAYYNNAVTVDGGAVTLRWQGGTAPTSGSASSIDIYSYNIIKTGSSTFTVLASQTKF